MVSIRVNGQFSVSSCLILLASQMGRADKAFLSQEPIYRTDVPCSQHGDAASAKRRPAA